MNSSFYNSGGCKEQLEACYKAGTGLASNQVCSNADDYCVSCFMSLACRLLDYLSYLQNQYLFSPAAGDLNVNDLRQKDNSTNTFPYRYYVDFLLRREVMTRIGAEVQYQECPDAPRYLFVTTGDVSKAGFYLIYLTVSFN